MITENVVAKTFIISRWRKVGREAAGAFLCDINRMQQSSMRQWDLPKDITESGKETLPRVRDRQTRTVRIHSWSGKRYAPNQPKI